MSIGVNWAIQQSEKGRESSPGLLLFGKFSELLTLQRTFLHTVDLWATINNRMARGYPVLSKLSKKHSKAIELHLEGKTIQQQADAVGVTRDAVTHWRADPLYKEELAKRTQQRNKDHRKVIGNLLRQSANVLTKVMQGDDTITTAQRTTAIKILGINHLASYGIANAPAGTTVTQETGNAPAEVNIKLVKT